jgi:sec-independent protein translocase protein TatB
MLDIGWSEMALIVLLALIVIGPKDLPRVMRTVGQWMRKARGMARDFQSSLDEMIEDDELREAKRSIEQQTRNMRKRDAFGIGDSLEKHVDPSGSLRDATREVSETARVTDTGGGSGAGKASGAGGTATDAAPANGSSGPTGVSAVAAGTTSAAGSAPSDAAPNGPVTAADAQSEPPSDATSSAGDGAPAKPAGATYIETQTPVAPGNSVNAGKSTGGGSTTAGNGAARPTETTGGAEQTGERGS